MNLEECINKLEWKTFDRKLDFNKHGYTIIPGSILKYKNGKIKLVGDVNIHLSYCDDCQDDLRDIVEIAHIDHLL